MGFCSEFPPAQVGVFLFIDLAKTDMPSERILNVLLLLGLKIYISQCEKFHSPNKVPNQGSLGFGVEISALIVSSGKDSVILTKTLNKL